MGMSMYLCKFVNVLLGHEGEEDDVAAIFEHGLEQPAYSIELQHLSNALKQQLKEADPTIDIDDPDEEVTIIIAS